MEIPINIAENLAKIKVHFFEDDYFEIVESIEAEIALQEKKSEFLAFVFSYYQSNIAKSVILSMDTFFQSIEYNDLVEACQIIKNDQLTMYYYTRFIVEYLNIDVLKMTQIHDRLKGAYGHATKALPIAVIRIGDTSESEEIDHRIKKLRSTLKSQGAPMLDD